MEKNPHSIRSDRDPNKIYRVIHHEGELKYQLHRIIDARLAEGLSDEEDMSHDPYEDPADRTPESSRRRALGPAITKAALVSPETGDKSPIELEQVVTVSEYYDPSEKFDYAQDTMPIPAYYPNKEDHERANSPDLTVTEAQILAGAPVYTIPGVQLFGQVTTEHPAVHIATPSGVITGRYHGSYGFPSGDKTLWVYKDKVVLIQEQANEL